ncbi:amino acid/polyamine/organocation transporter, APC superfamily [Actinacidiphila yanglinensis]|uniref:Amino acid/polyamine/organocation transporter, APC superfamily n=1 Tax=Actinacidiphila yanglinensis TaxID=310779 RepID=A0A1H6CTQ2_9ACTN|nr:APC family permease [Actinacidiphila yanglinensis]SEG76449.1 amino acid/polyamine/organocation transporter, APC superfamily [Actinacidiphila yanglinensis]
MSHSFPPGDAAAVPTDVPVAGPPGQPPSEQGRFSRTLTTPKIVFIVVAAAAPLAAMVFTVPLSFALGAGPGVPALYLCAGLTLLCFTCGYAAISREVRQGGGFYGYIARGLGRPVAVGAGMVAVVAYNAVAVSLVGAFAYFARDVAAAHGLRLAWEVWAALGLAAVGVLGYRHVELSARALAVFMVGEVAVLLALDVAVLVERGASALPAASFAPHQALAPGAGVSVMFAFASFIGFESAALYGEEARDPGRSVPRATLVAVLLVASFYAFTSWITVGAVGADRVRATAAAHLGDLYFGLGDRYLGAVASTAMQLLLCTSLFASWLALHNAANRYLLVLGRDRLLPGRMDALHPRHRAPHRASVVQTAVGTLVAAVFAAAGLDPFLNMSTSLLGLGTLGIIALQALASVAVLGFYRGRPRHWWRTALAPALGAAGLVAATVLVLANFPVLTGTSAPLVTSLPWLLAAAATAGTGYALWLRTARPRQYARLAGLPGPTDRIPAQAPPPDPSTAPPDRTAPTSPSR